MYPDEYYNIHGLDRFQLYCTDNAGMIGITGYYKYLNNKFTCQKISASSRMKVDQY